MELHYKDLVQRGLENPPFGYKVDSDSEFTYYFPFHFDIPQEAQHALDNYSNAVKNVLDIYTQAQYAD